ncbi:HdeD family acid-resistance protein [Gracilibacillus alcaliphilus]|uniref:HdeD family acid-resistance protein n=1 Tax=Gracilibacillus alcaliphilus TaxID=1401441 RepID=UPI0019567FEF|nr:DUF308 domain-containing protein [Gracilibacillus alcaliphilus]MBM7675660.1 uncharacterized membrane protein HdeD (DUF308 family) [Gracilibacillus alcaliphilus]
MLKNFKENFQRHAILRAVIFILIGAAIFINPEGFLRFIGYLIAGYLTLLGVIKIYQNHKLKQQTGSYGMGLAGGIILIILAGVFLYFAPTLFSILPFLLGLAIVINGLMHLIVALNIKSTGWTIFCILLVIGGAVLVFNPFQSTLILFQTFGVILACIGISEIVGHFQNSSTRKS